VYHDVKGMIMSTQMTLNRMFHICTNHYTIMLEDSKTIRFSLMDNLSKCIKSLNKVISYYCFHGDCHSN